MHTNVGPERRRPSCGQPALKVGGLISVGLPRVRPIRSAAVATVRRVTCDVPTVRAFGCGPSTAKPYHDGRKYRMLNVSTSSAMNARERCPIRQTFHPLTAGARQGLNRAELREIAIKIVARRAAAPAGYSLSAVAGSSRQRPGGLLDLTNLPTTIRYCLGCRDVREGVPWRVYNACLASMARPEGHFIFVRNAGRL
jgi:hypothetical protein